MFGKFIMFSFIKYPHFHAFDLLNSERYMGRVSIFFGYKIRIIALIT